MGFQLSDKYSQTDGKFVMSGIHAIVKISLLQKELDRRRNLDTAGFVTGYRGSPLGSVDLEFMRQKSILEKNNIKFHPSINEDLAVGALTGTQQLAFMGKPTVDGVFGFWYGKGPGVDRSGDQFKHSSFSGTTKFGGCLAFAGDDHSNKSSTVPHETGPTFKSWSIPVITPATVEDEIRLGLLGIEMSRYSGLWSSIKIISNLADAYQTVNVDLDNWTPVIPSRKFDVHARWPDLGVEQEARIIEQKIPALKEFIKHNNFDSYVHAQNPLETYSYLSVGIVAVGKSYVDTLTAMQKLGITTDDVGLYKVGIAWPLNEPQLLDFCNQYDEILVVEEKSAMVEDQMYKLLRHQRPLRIYGKDLLPQKLDFDAYEIAKALKEIFKKPLKHIEISDKFESIESRNPHFCSGCPHSSSTVLPEGSKALIGIGCHYMTAWMKDRPSVSIMPMGGEGTNWISARHYQESDHIFANLGDGTYFHSGILAIRASVAAQSNITYKILYNGAVAMTGGQPIDGEISVPRICKQVMAEGVENVAIVTEDGYFERELPYSISIHSKDEYLDLQKRYRKIKGTSVIIFDQQCATEKRRKRKRNLQEAPKEYVWINPSVCENCGDCSKKSNCLSIIPTETKLGTKRKIDTSNCNYSYDCLEGFCPSFATIKGPLPQPKLISPILPNLTNRINVPIRERQNILISGIGGAGIISTSQMLCVSAHIDGIKVISTDQTGLAQKYGAVTSTISLGDGAQGRMFPKSADIVIGIDPQVTAMGDSMRFIGPNTTVILNSEISSNSELITNRDWSLNIDDIVETLRRQCKEVIVLDASTYAKKITGNILTVNQLLLGYAFQKGLIWNSEQSMFTAMEQNGVAVNENKLAWEIGRHSATDEGLSILKESTFQMNHAIEGEVFLTSLHHRYDLLKKYQNVKYADLYFDLCWSANSKDFTSDEYSMAIVKNLYKLMAYKDEYEVARIWASTPEVDSNLNYHMCLPWNRKSQKKTRIGSWARHFFKILQYGKILRGTPFDPLGYSDERKLERNIRDQYITLIKKWTEEYTEETKKNIIKQAKLVDDIRGFGHVKIKSIRECRLFKKSLIV